MRIRIKLAALAMVCGMSTFSSAQNNASQANTAAQPAPGVKVGVIDIGYIFDNHPAMKPMMAAIDAQIKSAEDEINARREAMVKEVESLRGLNENSIDFKKKEEALADAESKLKLDFVRREKQFQLDKAKLVYDTYKQVEAMTKAVAESNQFGIILRYSRTEMDPTKPNTVQGGINKDIVYFSPGIDFTEFVLSQIKQTTPVPAATTPPAGQIGRAPGAGQGANPGQGQAPRVATPPNAGALRK